MKNRNYVNLNINPCKMCMPMGAVQALKGIENTMVILHGSQGCSTYIRRHMAGHYNEPIDIGSSSLNEDGTVYGGEKNLKKGLENMITLYQPELIGVATTCLAETIGEDVRRITSEFMEEHPSKQIKIVPVSTPGYGGTQFEGYFSALLGIVREFAKDTSPNHKINVIVPNLNPGDVRNIKSILKAFEINYILLPDVSVTLDAPYEKEYSRIPRGGTRLAEIDKMAGAAATLELGITVPEKLSPGAYLKEAFGVPLYRCPLPMGVENTDILMNLLSKLSDKPVPTELQEERGRLIDGMIDSHKYNGEGRAVLYGEPELVYAVGKLCLENGIRPVLISTGSESEKLRQLFEKEKDLLVIDDTDFETIRNYSNELKANLWIGNSDGKFITEKEGIPLIRIGFPIHDRIGGQRLVCTGYHGTLRFLDDITNTLIERKHENYRQTMFEQFFQEGKEEAAMIPGKIVTTETTQLTETIKIAETMKSIKTAEIAKTAELAEIVETVKIAEIAETTEIAEIAEMIEKTETNLPTLEEKTKSHPCFSSGACKNARMHIPVAPACNISCNYCNRKFDCVNESRPGVTSEILSPEEAAIKFAAVKKKFPNLKVVGIAGPGDALANFDKTKKSIELIKEIDPGITFCLSTNGLMLPAYVDEIVTLGVSHVTVTINTVNPDIGAKIYREINYKGKKYTGTEGARLLLLNQLTGLMDLTSSGVVCKVNIVMLEGINEKDIESVVKRVKECGAIMTNIMPLIPSAGSVFENMPQTSNKELNKLREKCGVDLKQMYHCRQCRADAIGLLEEDRSAEFRMKGCGGHKAEKNTDCGSYTFAVASKSGLLVDEHFGHVEEFRIYRNFGEEIRLIEKREVNKFCTGAEECDTEESKMNKIMKTIEDCNAVLVLRIGYNPLKILEEKGIRVVQTCETIHEAVKKTVRLLSGAMDEEMKIII